MVGGRDERQVAGLRGAAREVHLCSGAALLRPQGSSSTPAADGGATETNRRAAASATPQDRAGRRGATQGP